MQSRTVFKVAVMIAAIVMCVCACGAPATRKPNAANIPPGTYKESCSGCLIIEEDGKKVLSCLCPKRCGTLNPTKMVLDGSCRGFGNNDGDLVCDKDMDNDANVPKGPYENQCGGCSYNEETHMLACKKCKALNKKYIASSVEIKEGCVIDVNAAGQLVCRENEAKTSDIKDTMADDNAEKKEL